MFAPRGIRSFSYKLHRGGVSKQPKIISQGEFVFNG